MYRGLENEANDRGCLPILFKAMVNHGKLLHICRKENLARRLLSQIDQVYARLNSFLPRELFPNDPATLNLFKDYLELADKYCAGECRHGVAPERENRLGG